jgi:hypothetical protein
MQHGTDRRGGRTHDQPEPREGTGRAEGSAERFVVPVNSGNAEGGKGPQFKTDATCSEEREIG